VIIAPLPGFITKIEVEHAIKACAFTSDVLVNSIEIGLHIVWIGDLIGIATGLPSSFPQDKGGVAESQAVESVTKQRFISNQNL